jgi:large subunit ribosomal protein L30
MVYAVVRIRGIVNVKPDIKKTLQLLRLTRANHCVLLEENKVNKGMLQIVKDYTTWGEINEKTMTTLLTKRGMIVGDKPLTDEYVKTATSFDSIKGVTKSIMDKKFTYAEIPDIKPLFRLNPPKKGFEGIKRSFRNGGALGYRGKEMNQLLERMLI